MAVTKIDYNASEVQFTTGVMETYLRWREMNGPPRGYEIYHPSAFGKCLRLMQYQRYEERGLIKGVHEQFEGRMLRLFENGHHTQARWEKYFTELGVLRGVWKCANPSCAIFDKNGKIIPAPEGKTHHDVISEGKRRTYGKDAKIGVFKPDNCACGSSEFTYHEILVEDKELNFRGHCDLIIDFSRFDVDMFDKEVKDGKLKKFFNPANMPTKPFVADFKTVGVNQYQNKVKKHGPHDYYLVQIQVYMNVLDLYCGMIMYEQKDQFELAFYKVDRDESKWQEIRRQAIKMQELAEENPPKLPPPRPISKSSWDCKSCSYQQVCHKSAVWKDPKLEEKRKSFYGELL
jgi:CRISPR/Cas system-associated exonuclease Cas4 (RecB family)